jgi:hypothetical protein
MKLGWLVLLALGTATSGAQAQECFHPPVMVPALSGPPVWMGPAGGTDWRPQLHDPRWSGAPVRLFTTSTTGIGALYNGQYRVLNYGGVLYVSMQVISDADTSSGDSADAVYFGFTDGPAPSQGAYLVAIRPSRAGATIPAPGAGVPQDTQLPIANNNLSVSWYQTTNHTLPTPTWTAHTFNVPAWLQDTVTWNGSPGVSWAITFKIDLPSLGITGAPEIFAGERIGNGGGTTFKLGNSTLATSDPVSIGGGTISPVNQDDWVDYSAPGTACSGGVQLASNHIGVYASGALTNEVASCGGAATPCTPPDDVNTFRAELQHVDNAIGPTAHAVRAKFRIADWGATISNWKLAPWKPIAGISDTVFTDPTLPPSWSWNFTAGGGGFGDAVIQFTCAAAPGDGYCPKLTNPDDYTHQCMLVELGAGPTAQALKFDTAAVYRNMDFEGLSTLDRKAKITIQGLQQLLGQAGNRDVYLHVQTLNMPAHGKEPIWLPASKMAEARRYAENPPPVPALPGRDKPADKKEPRPGEKPAKPAARPDLKLQPLPAPQPAPEPVAAPGQGQKFPNPSVDVLDVPVMTPTQALESVWPTYKIYPYVDIGRTTTIEGTVYKEVDPMVPFGYYLEHDGPLFGFSHALRGLNGAVITEVAPNLYKVTIVNEGAVEVSTKITAEEAPKGGTTPPQCPACPPKGHRCQCDVPGAPVGGSGWLAALLAAASVVLRRKNRKSS